MNALVPLHFDRFPPTMEASLKLKSGTSNPAMGVAYVSA